MHISYSCFLLKIVFNAYVEALKWFMFSGIIDCMLLLVYKIELPSCASGIHYY